jgi:hypothetical protein
MPSPNFSFGKDAPSAAKDILEVSDIETLFFVQDGAEGPRGWKASLTR